MIDLRTPAATKVVGGLSLLAIAALSWTLVVGPETHRLADVDAEIVSTQDQNSTLTLQLSQLRRQQSELAGTRRTARRMGHAFPATADQPGLFEQVTTAATDAGIGSDGVTTLAPSPPVVGGATGAVAPGAAASAGLASQTVTVAVSGSYDEIHKLLENLEHMDRAYLITGLDVAGAEDGTYTATVSGEMFVMPPMADPGEAIDLVSAAAKED